MITIQTIALLCALTGRGSPKETSIRQHNCQKWYISCLERAKRKKGIVFELKQCIKER